MTSGTGNTHTETQMSIRDVAYRVARTQGNRPEDFLEAYRKVYEGVRKHEHEVDKEYRPKTSARRAPL